MIIISCSGYIQLNVKIQIWYYNLIMILPSKLRDMMTLSMGQWKAVLSDSAALLDWNLPDLIQQPAQSMENGNLTLVGSCAMFQKVIPSVLYYSHDYTLKLIIIQATALLWKEQQLGFGALACHQLFTIIMEFGSLYLTLRKAALYSQHRVK